MSFATKAAVERALELVRINRLCHRKITLAEAAKQEGVSVRTLYRHMRKIKNKKVVKK